MLPCSAYSDAELDAINRAGVEISKLAAGKQALVFASIGPTGKILMSGEIEPRRLPLPLRRRPGPWPRRARTPC